MPWSDAGRTAPGGAPRAHYPWPVRTLPRLAIGFHGPAYSDESGDKAALNLLAEIAFSPSSPLYQRLVNEERKCLSLGACFADTRDPSLLVFNAVVKSTADLPYVEREILKELDRIKAELVPPDILADTKSNLSYAMAAALGTTDGVAGTLAFYVNLAGDPGTLNKLFDLYDKIDAPEYPGRGPKIFPGGQQHDRHPGLGGWTMNRLVPGILGAVLILAAGALSSCKRVDPAVLTMELLPVPDNPLVAFRILVKIGSANDPSDKEGLAQLTWSLLADGRQPDPGDRRNHPGLPPDGRQPVPEHGQGDGRLFRHRPQGQPGALLRHPPRHAPRSRLPGG